ncbi:ATP-binding protein [Patescibacteria group bacterium]|nr:ATP-binding protein [Patescibacteria group bacterium]MBU2036395.1 ATP-binding protein [Patescibacteria group bacterium]
MIVRHLDQALASHFTKYNEVLVLLGARQVGKTTILKRIFSDAHYLVVDNEPIKNALERYDPAVYKQLLNSNDSLIVVDEIHKLSDPGRAAKIFFDQLPEYKLIITGSSAFNIKNKASESLAGRKIDYYLYPLSLSEYLVQNGLENTLSFRPMENLLKGGETEEIFRPYDHKAVLNNILVYGLYPAMQSHPSDSVYLTNLIDSVVFKDLVELSLLENKPAALSLLKLLAYQIGSQVNYAELASKLGIGARTVKRYIELFEQSFIIFTIKPYTSRKRDEIAKMPKVFFYDLGLRNALINNFDPVENRGDSGQLFENFIVSELFKYNYYGNFGYNFNYWRTKGGSEVDLVLSKSNHDIIAVEIKSKSQRINQAFMSRYPESRMVVISKDNYWV